MEENLSQEQKELINLLDKKTEMVAMVAPSFIVDFDYPEIVKMLKKLGFKYVVEVTKGAEETNRQLLELLEKYPDKRWITNPCPAVVRLVRSKYPHLLEYLAPIDSPMSATAKIVNKEYPGLRKVFFGPCLMKKLEAKEDRSELEILVLTYKELQQVLFIKGIFADKHRHVSKNSLTKFFQKLGLLGKEKEYAFDISARSTRLYPISGGLADSSGVSKKLTDAEFDEVSSPILVNKALREFLENKDLKVLDILNCEGGCINGPGVISKDGLDARRQRVINFYNKK